MNPDSTRRGFLARLAAAGLAAPVLIQPSPGSIDSASPGDGILIDPDVIGPEPYDPPDPGPVVGTLPGDSVIPAGMNSDAANGGGGTDSLLPYPRILIVIVDQWRYPMWLTTSQAAAVDDLLQNVTTRIRNKSVVFTCAANCTPARSTLLTGLYTHQTHLYRGYNSASDPTLDAFPTWAHALAELAPSYANHIMWFGKWHLSEMNSANPLADYGFEVQLANNAMRPSPDGSPNEGTMGIDPPPDGQDDMVRDKQIAEDFVDWLAQVDPGVAWCATVSFVNPHDINYFPGFFPIDWNYPTEPVPTVPAHPNAYGPVFPPAPATPLVEIVSPSGPLPILNFESTLSGKPGVQAFFKNRITTEYGPLPDTAYFAALINWYYQMQKNVDDQIGAVLDAIEAKYQDDNTIVIFTSDHGEYLGSHGIHCKGSSGYDEGIRVPLYVRLPGMTDVTLRTQMCSSVDFLRLVCDLATRGTVDWETHPTYSYLAGRESIHNFIYDPAAPQSRIVTIGGVDLPYILHTFDEMDATQSVLTVSPSQFSGSLQSHLVCLRTNRSNAAYQVGGKMVHYYSWAECDTKPEVTQKPQVEFFAAGNTLETTNDGGDCNYPYNPANPAAFNAYMAALGNFYGGGLISSELRAPLPASFCQAQKDARDAYLIRRWGGSCTLTPPCGS